MTTLALLISWFRSLIKPSGKHRARPARWAPQHPPAPPRTAVRTAVVAWPRIAYGLPRPLVAVDGPLVRPYIAAHERQQRRLQARRRRLLYAAVYLGLDLDQRVIHTAAVVR